ncbi:MAG: UDP-N-acetylglucosamine 1-carboxyvinyltransferase [Patescibacteria group bacterium]
MQKFIIEGGNRLCGEVTLAGAKNSGFKLMIAGLLSEEESKIGNFSKIGDVVSTAKIIEELGGKVTFRKNHHLEVRGANLNKFELSEKHGRLSRASTYFVGPLLARFGKAIIPVPGGCKIGRRSIDWHLEGFKALGANFKYFGDYCLIEASKLKGATYRFPKNTHGGTDVMIIASVLAEGATLLENAALEPEVDDLIAFLNQMGAKIKRLPNRRILIQGVKKLKGTSHQVMPDRNEAVTFACVALITKGDVFVRKANPKVLTAFLDKIKEIKGGYEVSREGIRFFYKHPLRPSQVITAPYPGFMTDWQALWTVLMTQAQGTSTVHETIFENRFGYVPDLIKMGAKIELFNPEVDSPQDYYNFNWEDNKQEYFHAVKILGPTNLWASQLNIGDIRAGATLILAALVAKGKTELLGVEHIFRGYENLDERLRTLGAKIQRE